MMKTTMIAALAVLATSTSAFAQDAGGVDITLDNDLVDVDTDFTIVEDSFDDNTDNFNDSFDDNSDNNSFNDNSNREFTDSFDDNRDYVDSFDDNSDTFTANTNFNSNNVFDDNAIVAEATLSNVVTGVDVDFGDVEDSARFVNRLNNSGNAFRNYSGLNALNQNTGVGASQNASVTIAVSTDSFDVD